MNTWNKTWILLLFYGFIIIHKVFPNSRPDVAPKVSMDTVPRIPHYSFRTDQDLDVLIEAIGNSRIVLLGESTHGTHEFYEWRSTISKRLIQEKGFDFIAVEGDWDDSYKVNQFVKGPPQDSAAVIELLRQYDRWPASIWGNYETASLVQWLNTYNQNRSVDNKIGFYGVDVYSFWEWTDLSLTIQDTAILNAAKQVQQCFSAYSNDALKYTDAVRKLKVSCSTTTARLWDNVEKRTAGKQLKDEALFVLQQQAFLTLHGERYFRSAVNNRVQSWNLRDNYMALTIKRLLNFHGPNSKVIVWAHNSHAGDAFYSNMHSSGHTSVGEILRKEFREKVFIVGFGTYKGSVMAGYKWGNAVQKLNVPPARVGSWEHMLHRLSAEDKIILSKDLRNNTPLKKWISFRSIGAAYPEVPVYGYSIIPKRFDAFVFIDSTTALRPIEMLKKGNSE